MKKAPSVKEFKVNLQPFPDGGGFYAVVPVSSPQECNRCQQRAAPQEPQRLLLFFGEPVWEWEVEICCEKCGDLLLEAHAKARSRGR